MIRFYKDTYQITPEKTMMQIACNSTDDKPTTGVATGSLCLEVDTGKMYAFSEKTSTWTEI